ncbi:MAG: Asp23/Gls24 family envelope stress response protein [Candidatus Omnitrophica bacterium]|nr:Asp23/Gls24 family envelope stress response protein [Candidatus Omnitrophota bacterium]
MSPKTDLGAVVIRNEVIASVAALAAREVPGVVDIWRGPLPFLSGLCGLGTRGVRVETKDQEVRLWLNLVAEYEVSLPHLAAQVQDRVREVLERMTHLNAVEINVGIHHVQTRGDLK